MKRKLSKWQVMLFMAMLCFNVRHIFSLPSHVQEFLGGMGSGILLVAVLLCFGRFEKIKALKKQLWQMK